MNKRYVGIDPSSKTGLVILDENANVLVEEEIKVKHRDDPLRMIQISEMINSHLQDSDSIIIEGFSFQSKGKGISFQFGLGWVIRSMLFYGKYTYIDVPPTVVKKFCCNKGNAKKEDLIQPIKEKWGYENNSDNILDAYIMARIAWSMDNHENLKLYEKKIIRDLLKSK